MFEGPKKGFVGALGVVAPLKPGTKGKCQTS